MYVCIWINHEIGNNQRQRGENCPSRDGVQVGGLLVLGRMYEWEERMREQRKLNRLSAAIAVEVLVCPPDFIASLCVHVQRHSREGEASSDAGGDQ